MKFELFMTFLTSAVFIVDGVRMLEMKQNWHSGLRTAETLSDPEIWKKANKISGIIFMFLGLVVLFPSLSAVFIWNNWVLVSLLCITAGVLFALVFCISYASKLARKKRLDGTLNLPDIPKSFVYAMVVVSLCIALVGAVLIFFPQNSLFGIRLMRNVGFEKKANVIFGLGLFALGSIFHVLLLTDLKKMDKQKTNIAAKFAAFSLAIFAWVLIMTIYAVAKGG